MFYNVPFYRFNSILVNINGSVINVTDDFSVSFLEYVKSQLDYMYTPVIYNRSIIEYKNCYLMLTESMTVDKELINKVVLYFYYDLSKSLKNIIKRSNINFQIDMNILKDFGYDFIDVSNLTMEEKISKMEQIRESEVVTLIGG